LISQNDFSIETTDGILEDETANISGDESITHLKATIDSSKKQEVSRKETDQKLKEQKGSNRSNKRTSGKSNCVYEGRITNSDMIRCNWCMDWYHDLCVGIAKSETVLFLVCPECRQLPKLLND
jgi:hypothetical protein